MTIISAGTTAVIKVSEKPNVAMNPRVHNSEIPDVTSGINAPVIERRKISVVRIRIPMATGMRTLKSLNRP